MKRNIRLAIVALAIMTASSTSALAQSATNNQPKDSTTYRPFQISFVPMLGTNGIESPRIANRLSVNIIAGISRALARPSMRALPTSPRVTYTDSSTLAC